jgi:hypothetical protein
MPMEISTSGREKHASKLMNDEKRIRNQIDWRSEMLARIRQLIKEADPEIMEEPKWKKPSNPAGIPVWSHNGLICTGETYKDHVKLTFPKGASLRDPTSLFNGTLGGNTWRAIDIHQGDKINESAFKDLIRDAVARNLSEKKMK